MIQQNNTHGTREVTSLSKSNTIGSIKPTRSGESIKSCHSVTSKMPDLLYSYNKPVGQSRVSGTSETISEIASEEYNDDISTIQTIRSHHSTISLKSARTPQLATDSSIAKSQQPVIEVYNIARYSYWLQKHFLNVVKRKE